MNHVSTWFILLLSERLREITNDVLQHSAKEVKEVMGRRIEALKFCPLMTLFDAVGPSDTFEKMLETFFDGARDSLTLQRKGNKGWSSSTSNNQSA